MLWLLGSAFGWAWWAVELVLAWAWWTSALAFAYAVPVLSLSGGLGCVAALASRWYWRSVADLVYGAPACDERTVQLLLEADAKGADLAVRAVERATAGWWGGSQALDAASDGVGGVDGAAPDAHERAVLVVMGGSGAVLAPLLKELAQLKGRRRVAPGAEANAADACGATPPTTVRVHVADASETALALLRDRHADLAASGELELHHLPDLVSEAGALATGFEDAAFDVVLAHGVLRRAPRARQRDALAELRRVCRGVFCVTLQETHRLDPLSQKAVLLNHLHLVSPYSTRDVMAELGFSVEERREDGMIALVGTLRR